MLDIHESLTAWRLAERVLDAMPRDAADWVGAQDEARHACLVYQAMVAQAEARYAALAAPSPSAWWPTLGPIRSSSAR